MLVGVEMAHLLFKFDAIIELAEHGESERLLTVVFFGRLSAYTMTES